MRKNQIKKHLNGVVVDMLFKTYKDASYSYINTHIEKGVLEAIEVQFNYHGFGNINFLFMLADVTPALSTGTVIIANTLPNGSYDSKRFMENFMSSFGLNVKTYAYHEDADLIGAYLKSV